MSKLPTFLHIPSLPSSLAAYPPQATTSKAGSGQGRDNNSNWVKVHQSQSNLDETLPVPVDFSIFLNQPISPFMESKGTSSSSSSSSNTQARTTMYVQDSGVVMISTSGLPLRQSSSSKTKSAATSSQSSRESSTSRTKPAPSGGTNGGDEIDDDWEVVYPDN